MNLFQDVYKIYTGVGKVNASYILTKEISENRPDVIINLGTAGSKMFNYGELIQCDQFVQRDMDAKVFGYDDFVTPSDGIPQILHYNSIIELPFSKGVCGTGDSFATNINGTELYNVCDMEAYALAKIAFLENIPFVCVKFISDGADNNAQKLWQDSLVIGARRMRTSYDLIVERLDEFFS